MGLLIGVIALIELYCSYAYYKYRDSLKNELKAIRLRQPFCNQVADSFKTDSSSEEEKDEYIGPAIFVV